MAPLKSAPYRPDCSQRSENSGEYRGEPKAFDRHHDLHRRIPKRNAMDLGNANIVYAAFAWRDGVDSTFPTICNLRAR
jgi:hypothetical protein